MFSNVFEFTMSLQCSPMLQGCFRCSTSTLNYFSASNLLLQTSNKVSFWELSSLQLPIVFQLDNYVRCTSSLLNNPLSLNIVISLTALNFHFLSSEQQILLRLTEAPKCEMLFFLFLKIQFISSLVSDF
jgi:hypothetical protein